jgi:hypothetical protein
MRKSMFASFAALVLGASLALTGCKVGDDGGGDTGGDDNPGNDEGDDEGETPDAAQAQGCPPSVEEFETDVYEAALGPAPAGKNCVGCHASGVGGFTISETDQAGNLTRATAKATKDFNGDPALLARPLGNSHPVILTEGDSQYQALKTFVDQVTGANGACE